MKVNELWLREWVNPALDTEALAAQLTIAGLEVESVSPVAGPFDQVVVAKVIQTQAHPKADRLTLCQVDCGEAQPLSIVCGAANVRAGLKVALAKVGATLPGDFKIKPAKLRGEPSMGMLCSEKELGLAEQSEGIMELDEEASIGQCLRAYLQLDDHVFDIDLTPNRADCFSVRGIAREIAALNRLTHTEKTIPACIPSNDTAIKVHLDDTVACPHYCARVIKGINLEAKTPTWMLERLRRCGLRPLHPVVDVTHYVMLELGQPMHAFKLEAIEGDIQVRKSKAGETITLLDGQSIEIKEGHLLIADDKKPLALAGIMGGEMSAVDEQTSDLLLESAYFNPLSIAGVGRQYGLSTDASQRYERGVDPELQFKALERATSLLLEICGGEAGPITEVIDHEHMPTRAQINFEPALFKRLTGVELSLDEMKHALELLGMVVKEDNGKNLSVTVPSYRFDIKIAQDLVEELLILYGYNNLQASPMDMPMQSGDFNSGEAVSSRLATWFAQRAYHQTITYSFVDSQLQEALYDTQDTLTLLNPISSDLAQMRLGLWPGLIASMVYNLHRQQNSIKLFEIGVAFQKKGDQIEEIPMIGGLVTGFQAALDWSEPTRTFDFFDVKGDLEAVLGQFGIKTLSFKPSQHPALHPGQTAAISIAGQEVGYIGVLHPAMTQELDIDQAVILFELSINALRQADRPKYQAVSKYPLIRRDLSFLVDNKVSIDEIKALIFKSMDKPWLQSVEVFDLYQGKGIPEGKKSLAIALKLQDKSRTLIDAEINDLISAIIKSLETNFAITLRE